MTPPPPSFVVRKCLGKRRFASRKAAAECATRSGRDYGKALRPYYCELCRGYHNTSQSEQVQKSYRRRARRRERQGAA